VVEEHAGLSLADTQDAELIHWIFSVPIGMLLCILGILGNLVSVVVWFRVQARVGKSNTTIRYFIAMGFIDSLLLVMFLLKDSIPAIHPQFVHTYGYVAAFSYFFFPVFFYCILASIWIVVAVTLHRYLLIVHNYKMSRRTHSVTLVALFLVGFIINFPHFFSFQPHRSDDDSWKWVNTEYAKKPSFERYEFWVHCIFIVLAPWISIAVMNAAMVFTIAKTKRRMAEFTSNDTVTTKVMSQPDLRADGKAPAVVAATKKPKKQKTTGTLLTVTFTFLALLLWQCVAQCFWMQGFHKTDMQNPQIWNAVNISFGVAKIGIVVYSSMNCLLYFFTGSLFKNELYSLLGSRR